MSRRISLFLMDAGSYQTQLREECITAARHHGFEAQSFVANNNPHAQVEQIERCLSEPPQTRPTVLMVSPVRESVLVASARMAARLGVGWVLLNRWSDAMTELHREFADVPIFCVSADQYEVGRIQARQLRALLPEGGEVLYLRGPTGTSSVTRRFAGLQEVLNRSSIQISAVNSDWTVEGGRREMKAWLRMFQGWRTFPTIVVGAQNDSMALGARQAFLDGVRMDRPHRVHFLGCDGSATHGLRWASEGTLAATVVIPPVAGRAVGELASLLSGYTRREPEILLKPSSFPELHVLERIGAEGRTSGIYGGSSSPSTERVARTRMALPRK